MGEEDIAAAVISLARLERLSSLSSEGGREGGREGGEDEDQGRRHGSGNTLTCFSRERKGEGGREGGMEEGVDAPVK